MLKVVELVQGIGYQPLNLCRGLLELLVHLFNDLIYARLGFLCHGTSPCRRMLGRYSWYQAICLVSVRGPGPRRDLRLCFFRRSEERRVGKECSCGWWR